MRGWLTSALSVSAVVSVLGLAWGALFIVLPGAVGAWLLGQTWPGVQSILVPTILGQLGATIGLGPSVMLVAMDRTRRTFLLSMLQSPLILLGGIGGVLLERRLRSRVRVRARLLGHGAHQLDRVGAGSTASTHNAVRRRPGIAQRLGP